MIFTAATVTGFSGAMARIKAYQDAHSDEKLNNAALAGAVHAAQLSVREMHDTPEYAGPWRGARRKSGPPGGYPAFQTGKLARSYEVKLLPGKAGVAAWDAGGSTTIAGDKRTTYAKYVEFGTSRMQPRPFMLITATKYRREIQQKMKDEME